jgi:DNA-binding MarR family transcriptional regulator
LQIVIAYKANQTITVKSLFSSLPHSYTAIRHHYKRLLKDELIKHRSDDADARVKYIEPTEKLIKVISGFTQYADTVLNPPPPTWVAVSE